ncbi:hypothetical protein B0I00_0242 [Novosphingobium kunmingense]|uniref:Uncharacterized protein n=1 Tax=Novosphingobium kunmingense TaxID=1211806 RepID=A0A2N0I1M0_9SPHN|nr:hypothetical protein [Novosphingobium kunmingense]PKB25061.1 hypothetical protein B0I00_0242 [Novosphingobium kunmingense]
MFDLARLGQYDAAIRLVEVLANDPHRGESGKAMLMQIKTMRDAAGASAVDTGKPAGDATR